MSKECVTVENMCLKGKEEVRDTDTLRERVKNQNEVKCGSKAHVYTFIYKVVYVELGQCTDSAKRVILRVKLGTMRYVLNCFCLIILQTN